MPPSQGAYAPSDSQAIWTELQPDGVPMHADRHVIPSFHLTQLTRGWRQVHGMAEGGLSCSLCRVPWPEPWTDHASTPEHLEQARLVQQAVDSINEVKPVTPNRSEYQSTTGSTATLSLSGPSTPRDRGGRRNENRSWRLSHTPRPERPTWMPPREEGDGDKYELRARRLASWRIASE